MSDHLRGVTAQIKSEQPAALHIHCLAHCLNLCLQDAGRICSHVRDTLELIVKLVKLIKYSPKRSSLFQSLNRRFTRHKMDRWTVRTGAIGAVISNYNIVCSTRGSKQYRS